MRSRDDVVRVTRPDGSEATVSRAAWQGVYQYRDGWALAPDAPEPHDLASMKRAELNEVAAKKGLDPTDYRTVDDIRAAIEGAD